MAPKSSGIANTFRHVSLPLIEAILKRLAVVRKEVESLAVFSRNL